MITLHKKHKRYDPCKVIAYDGEETIYVDPNNPCLNCHDPSSTHQQWSMSVNVGVGISTSAGSAGINVDNNGNISGAVSGADGFFQGGASITYNPNPGPRIEVNSSGVQLPESTFQTYSADPDNTRVN